MNLCQNKEQSQACQRPFSHPSAGYRPLGYLLRTQEHEGFSSPAVTAPVVNSKYGVAKKYSETHRGRELRVTWKHQYEHFCKSTRTIVSLSDTFVPVFKPQKHRLRVLLAGALLSKCERAGWKPVSPAPLKAL